MIENSLVAPNLFHGVNVSHSFRRLAGSCAGTLFQILCVVLLGGGLVAGRAQTVVRIEATNQVASQPVVADVIPDLRKALSDQGYRLGQSTDLEDLNVARIRLVLNANALRGEDSANVPESFDWSPSSVSGETSGGTLSAATPLSLEAGILWLTDRVACTGKIPAQ